MANATIETKEDCKSQPEEEEEVVQHFTFPKHDLYVTEWLLSQTKIDITSLRVWKEIDKLVQRHWDEDYGAKWWQNRWVCCLDQKLSTEHGLEISLPEIDRTAAFEKQLEMAQERLLEFQQAYKLVSAPLSLTFLTCAGRKVCLMGDSCKCKKRVYATCEKVQSKIQKRRAQQDTLATTSNGGKKVRLEGGDGEQVHQVNCDLISSQEKVFEGMEFYLPHSSNVRREIERWKLEILIWVYGGTCNPKEADAMSRKAIVLATGDEDGNLWRIGNWYKCKLYRPAVIEKTIESGKQLNVETLKKFEFYISCD